MDLNPYNEEYVCILMSLGFQLYDSSNEKHCEPDIDIQDHEILFIEEEFCRQRIYVKLSDKECGDHFEIYVLDDIGCGSTNIPYNWAELAADWLTHLKYSLQLHGFMKDGKEIKKGNTDPF